MCVIGIVWQCSEIRCIMAGFVLNLCVYYVFLCDCIAVYVPCFCVVVCVAAKFAALSQVFPILATGLTQWVKYVKFDSEVLWLGLPEAGRRSCESGLGMLLVRSWWVLNQNVRTGVARVLVWQLFLFLKNLWSLVCLERFWFLVLVWQLILCAGVARSWSGSCFCF